VPGVGIPLDFQDLLMPASVHVCLIETCLVAATVAPSLPCTWDPYLWGNSLWEANCISSLFVYVSPNHTLPILFHRVVSCPLRCHLTKADAIPPWAASITNCLSKGVNVDWLLGRGLALRSGRLVLLSYRCVLWNEYSGYHKRGSYHFPFTLAILVSLLVCYWFHSAGGSLFI